MNRRLFWIAIAFWPSITLASNTGDRQLASEQTLEYSTNDELLAEAENLMVGYASAREEFPNKFSFLVRGQRWVSSAKRGVQRTETVFLGAVDESSIANPVGSHHYFAIGTKILDSIGEPQIGANNWLGVVGWHQWLRIAEDSYFRMGLDDKNDSKANLDIDSEEHFFGRRPSGTVDFFNVPVSLAGALNSQNVPRTFLHKYLRDGNIVRAAKTEQEIVGVWEVEGKPGAIVAVTFNAESRMPVSVAGVAGNRKMSMNY